MAEKVREECLRCWDDVVRVQSNPFRWKPNEAASGLLSQSDLVKEYVKLKPHLNCHTIRYAWAASYNMVARRNLQDTGIDPLVLCVAVRQDGKTKSCFDFWVSSEVVRRKHTVCPASTAEVKGGKHGRHELHIRQLAGFRPLVKVIEDQYPNVSSGHTVQIMQAHGIFVQGQDDDNNGNDAAQKPVITISVTKISPLVRLRKPTATFLKRCSESKTKTSKLDHAESENQSEAAGDDEQACREQELGLNMLAEEAEAHDSEELNAQDENDVDNNPDDDGFHHYVAQGLAAAFHPNVFNDDEANEAEVSDWMQDLTQENLAEAHDKAVALNVVGSKGYNIDSNSSQNDIEVCQDNLNMDPIDAAFETAFTAASGLPSSGGSDDHDQVTVDVAGALVLWLSMQCFRCLWFWSDFSS